jgi:uncharacterized protein (TIGR03067 family)
MPLLFWRTTVKQAWLVALLVVMLTGSLTRGDVESGMKEIEGTWLPESAELAGQPYPEKILKAMKLVVKDGRYIVTIGEQSDEGTVKVDASKTPKAMDITGTRGPNEGKTILAIYECKGDTIRVCYDLTGAARPSEFGTKPDTQLFLVQYKRAKS